MTSPGVGEFTGFKPVLLFTYQTCENCLPTHEVNLKFKEIMTIPRDNCPCRLTCESTQSCLGVCENDTAPPVLYAMTVKTNLLISFMEQMREASSVLQDPTKPQGPLVTALEASAQSIQAILASPEAIATKWSPTELEELVDRGFAPMDCKICGESCGAGMKPSKERLLLEKAHDALTSFDAGVRDEAIADLAQALHL